MFLSIFYFFFIIKIVQSAETLNIETSSNCGGEYSGYKYQLISPNYPKNYPDNIDCIYLLRGSHLTNCNQIFHMKFSDFSLKPSEDCKEDFVEIGDNNVFCGNVGGIRRYLGKNNALRIRFHSSKINGVGRGFNISITTLPCFTFGLENLGTSQFSYGNGEKNDENIITQFEQISEVPGDNAESFRIGYNNLYPVYRPQQQFAIEKGTKSTAERIGVGSGKNSTYNATSFDDNANHKLEVITGGNVKSDSSRPGKKSAYFFAPPDTETPPEPADFLSEQSLPSDSRILPFKSNEALSWPLQKNLSIGNQTPLLKSPRILNQKIEIPESSYGIPDIISHHLIPSIQTGEVFENTRKVIDCFDKDNINGGQVTSLENNYPVTMYGQPDSPFAYTLSPSFPRPPLHYLPTQPRPIGFVPALNPGNYFPTVPVNSGQCCGSLYSSQRFLLSSPGFPNLIYSGNPYQCTYPIAPYSPDICRLRLSFKFFNFGTADQFCSNGYLEIDGRRYCGCRSGLTVFSRVPNLLSKIISVRYTGFPKTKLNGFLIKVVQESCSYNGHVYLSRSKKDLSNVTVAENEQGLEVNALRIKRNSGYSYSKPDIPFDDVEEHLGRSVGIGHLGMSSATKCQAFSFVDWTLAAKETYLNNARCISGNGNGFISNHPNYPNNENGYPIYPGSGNGYPNYPGSGNSYPIYPGNGNSLPEYPGNRNSIPGYPEGETNLSNYPPNNGYPEDTFPGYPGAGQPNYPPSGSGVPPSSGICETVAVTEGIISSPFYPSAYPNCANKCWRFYRAPITCRLQLSFMDFDVERSLGCIKDYVAISNQNTRYCGRTLAGSKTHLGFPKSNFIDIRFTSDNFGTGRGFTIAFAQIPCQVEVNR